MKYVNAVLKKYCNEELSTLFAKTNNPAKEISESYAAYKWISETMESDGNTLDGYTNLHIGDGSTCRTGALFTFMSKSRNIKISLIF